MGFECANCKKTVSFDVPGTKNRNHCPFCLYSLHVDNKIGDRTSNCCSLMAPIAKMHKRDGEEVLVHKCDKCGLVRKNRVAGDDDFLAVESLEVIEKV